MFTFLIFYNNLGRCWLWRRGCLFREIITGGKCWKNCRKLVFASVDVCVNSISLTDVVKYRVPVFQLIICSRFHFLGWVSFVIFLGLHNPTSNYSFRCGRDSTTINLALIASATIQIFTHLPEDENYRARNKTYNLVQWDIESKSHPLTTDGGDVEGWSLVVLVDWVDSWSPLVLGKVVLGKPVLSHGLPFPTEQNFFEKSSQHQPTKLFSKKT